MYGHALALMVKCALHPDRHAIALNNNKVPLCGPCALAHERKMHEKPEEA